jgi:hypothetical protein
MTLLLVLLLVGSIAPFCTTNHSKGNGSDKTTSQLIILPYSALVPIRVMGEALNRAKQRAKQKPPPEIQEEQLFAEVQ